MQVSEGYAFLQHVSERRERGRQFVPSAGGILREERFLYLGQADFSLPLDEPSARILCDGIAYRIESAQAIYLGKQLHHWRALLSVEEEAAAWN